MGLSLEDYSKSVAASLSWKLMNMRAYAKLSDLPDFIGLACLSVLFVHYFRCEEPSA